MIPILEEGLGFNVYRAGLLFRRELIRALAEYSMTPEQWQVMMLLWQSGKPLNQHEIVQMLLKDKPTVSRIIKRLERDGWITKSSSINDGRVTVIEVTAKGDSFKKEVPQKLIRHFDSILRDFGDEETELLLSLLKRLRYALGDSLQ